MNTNEHRFIDGFVESDISWNLRISVCICG